MPPPRQRRRRPDPTPRRGETPEPTPALAWEGVRPVRRRPQVAAPVRAGFDQWPIAVVRKAGRTAAAGTSPVDPREEGPGHLIAFRREQGAEHWCILHFSFRMGTSVEGVGSRGQCARRQTRPHRCSPPAATTSHPPPHSLILIRSLTSRPSRHGSAGRCADRLRQPSEEATLE
jgi:hypothetical protein